MISKYLEGLLFLSHFAFCQIVSALKTTKTANDFLSHLVSSHLILQKHEHKRFPFYSRNAIQITSDETTQKKGEKRFAVFVIYASHSQLASELRFALLDGYLLRGWKLIVERFSPLIEYPLQTQ